MIHEIRESFLGGCEMRLDMVSFQNLGILPPSYDHEQR